MIRDVSFEKVSFPFILSRVCEEEDDIIFIFFILQFWDVVFWKIVTETDEMR